MKLSIIVVNWNTSQMTRQMLASVYRETRGFEYEIILIDNHSSDDSVECIRKEFPAVRLIENNANLGFGKANNQGLLVAQGEYIALLNSDTLVLDHALETLVSYLHEHADVMMVGPRLLNKDMTFQHACRRNLPNIQNSFFHLFGFTKIFRNSKKINAYKKFSDDPEVTEPVEALSGAAMVFRRTVYDNIGGFDEQFFMYGEDLDFCKRVKDHGWKTVYVSDAKIIHFGGASSTKRRTESLVNFYEAMWIYYKKHFALHHAMIFNACVWLGIKIKMIFALVSNSLKRS